MRSLLKLPALLFALSVIIISCGKDEEPSTNANSSLSNNVLSGKIDLFASGSADSISAYLSLDDYNTMHIGYSTIASNGWFSLKMATTPDLLGLVRFGDVFDNSFNGKISDPNAYISKYSIDFLEFKNGVNIGEIAKANFDSQYKEDSTGSTFSEFIYCDRDLKVSGKVTHLYDEETSYSYTYTANCDFKLVKGWNELIIKTVYFNKSTTGSIIVKKSLTNNITSDLKWRFFPYYLRSASAKSNTYNKRPIFQFMKK